MIDINRRKVISLSIALTGATAITAQIIFLREFLIVFYGNEITIGIILAAWLAWGAAGSIFAGRFSDRIRRGLWTFSLCQIALAALMPVTLLLIRLSKNIMGIPPGDIVGYAPIILSAFLTLMLPCALMGFMFSLACRIYKDVSDSPAEGIARVYVMEAVGALAGGIVVSYALIRIMHSSSIIFLLFMLNILAAVFTQSYSPPGRFNRTARALTAALAVLSAAVLLSGGGEAFRRFSIEKLWLDFNVLESKDSIYGNITVTERGSQLSFYENGLHLYTVPDIASAEEAVHFALLGHESPSNVLLIGGGVGGALGEILKHPVKKVDYVELDPAIINTARRYLPEKYTVFLDDPRVRTINEDGRFFVKRTGNKYDCVIINLGDPYTAQLNRFYTVEFFSELARILEEGGVAAFSLTSSAHYIGEELRDYLLSIFISAREVFPYVVMIPADTAHFIASDRQAALTVNSRELARRIEERGIVNLYVNEFYLFDRLSPERLAYAKEVLSGEIDVEVNRDFKPISYYYATAFWSTHFDVPAMRRLFRSVSSYNIWLFASVFCFLVVVFGVVFPGRRKKRDRKSVV